MSGSGAGLIGQPLLRQEDPRLLTGNGRYVTDLALPGTLHLAVLRSVHAHARITSIDVTAARGIPGVVAVLRADDVRDLAPLPVLAHPPGQRQTGFPVLPADKAVYVGQPLAAVVADTRYAAEDALEALQVGYDPLPVIADIEQATAPGAPRLYEAWPDNVVVAREIGSGDPDASFLTAHTIVEAAFQMPRQTAAPMEGRATCARFDAEAGELTVWASSQAPHSFRTVLASVLALEEERIRVIVPDVGGGFGVKLHHYPEEVLACVAAMRLGRPVKWVGGYESAVVRIEPSGRATVASGIIDVGQGIRSALAQVAAEILGLRYDRVTVVLGDTARAPYSCYGTADSRGSVVGGAAVLTAARAMRQQLAKLAAHLLEASEADIEIADGACRVRGAPGRILTVAAFAQEALRGQSLPAGVDPVLETRFTYHPENWTFPYGVHVAAVEVSRDTGAPRLLGYWVAHDCGTVLNPLLVDGQIQGGVAQGLGGALLEELVYDEAGQLLSRSFMDYAMPTAEVMPPIGIGHLETPSPHTPGGMKGMAEGGTIGAPATIANAVADALAPAGVDPAAITFYPLTAPRLFALLAGAGAAR